ncbi:MAG: hypothetical protein WC631_02850 [Candidatus Paceibacterota bacterium]|jgi:hypothetical protein
MDIKPIPAGLLEAVILNVSQAVGAKNQRYLTDSRKSAATGPNGEVLGYHLIWGVNGSSGEPMLWKDLATQDQAKLLGETVFVADAFMGKMGLDDGNWGAVYMANSSQTASRDTNHFHIMICPSKAKLAEMGLALQRLVDPKIVTAKAEK